MVPEPTEKALRPGLSLYANLLDANASAPGTISRAPVVFKHSAGGNDSDLTGPRQQTSVASLRFQPTKRPQASIQKSRAKPDPKNVDPSNVCRSPSTIAPDGEPSTTFQQQAKTTISDWAAELEDVASHHCYPLEKRQRGGRKKRKKTKEFSAVQRWDDIYDPLRPNAYEEYQNSDEKMLEIREWKDRLYAHRYGQVHDSSLATSEGPTTHSGQYFAPPIKIKDDCSATGINIVKHATTTEARPPQAVAANSGERTPSRGITAAQLSTIEPTSECGQKIRSVAREIPKAPAQNFFSPPPPELSDPEVDIGDVLAKEPEEPNKGKVPRSLRPGQKGFAERLMSKYGWTKGSGLGAGGTGIVKPLRVQIERQKKKLDSEGGGFVGPGGRGKIIGSQKSASKTGSEVGKWGVMSQVIILRGMLNGLDLEAELQRVDDGGLMQEIGDECGEKYGRVERVFIDGSSFSDTPVFVKFTSQLSALRAVNALEGRIFNGNAITARFYDLEKFDSGIYS
ncbi:MAG: hypothetical protein LQ341_005437 [Variospora aurantia]|nr:MAG: hypothetical protein LQ341_005437 [Variospora aurantia]